MARGGLREGAGRPKLTPMQRVENYRRQAKRLQDRARYWKKVAQRQAAEAAANS